MDITIVGLTEIAQRAGVQKQAVANWVRRHEGFPQPLETLATGSVWLWTPVKAWLIRTGREWDCELTREEVNSSEKRTIATRKASQ